MKKSTAMPKASRSRETGLRLVLRAMAKTGMEPVELAAELEVDAGLLSHWLAGDTPWPLDAVAHAAYTLGLEPPALMEAFAADYLRDGVRAYLDEFIAEKVIAMRDDGLLAVPE